MYLFTEYSMPGTMGRSYKQEPSINPVLKNPS